MLTLQGLPCCCGTISNKRMLERTFFFGARAHCCCWDQAGWCAPDLGLGATRWRRRKCRRECWAGSESVRGEKKLPPRQRGGRALGNLKLKSYKNPIRDVRHFLWWLIFFSSLINPLSTKKWGMIRRGWRLRVVGWGCMITIYRAPAPQK